MRDRLDMKDLLKEQAKDDCIKYGCPTLGVQHGTELVPRRAITIESTLLSPDLYECNFCGCLTNAKQRICCNAAKRQQIYSHGLITFRDKEF